MDDPTTTDGLPELDLRVLQLGEIRDMLCLPRDADHERVLHRLFEIGMTDRRVDTHKVPARYTTRSWALYPRGDHV